jgi:hypothetical protein
MAPMELHEKAFAIARDLKTKCLELFEILLEIERRQIYLGFDVTSVVASHSKGLRHRR